MFFHCFIVTVDFVAHTLSSKVVLAVTRSIAYPLLFCVYSLNNVFIPVNLCRSIPYFSAYLVNILEIVNSTLNGSNAIS